MPKLFCIAFLFAAVSVFAEERGEAVVLVYNSKMPASRDVAQHYAAKRRVPSNQIISLELPESEIITREDFREKLQLPLWKEMRARKLLTYADPPSTDPKRFNVISARVRYAVLCYGVPVKIAPDSSISEEAAEKLQPELRRNEAAVDSELALLPWLDHQPALVGFISNPFYLATNRTLLTPTNGVLMVARIDGPTPEIARGLVDKAVQAEAEGLWGRTYIDMRGITNGPMKPGDDWMQAAAEISKAYGYDTVVDKAGSTFPPSTPLPDIAFYFGWYDQSVSGPFTNGMAEFRPGAVAYHLHSFSSRVLRVSDVWWTGPLLAAGATATMGCTEEPYLQTTPQPNAFLARFLFLGFSFGEAAYAAQPALSWQNTIIGDPLYRPFKKTQKERYDQMEARGDRNIEWSMLMWVNVRLSQGASLEEIRRYYEANPQTQKSALLQEKLGDIMNAHGKIFDASDAYRAALKLPMTRLQRLRFALNAGPLIASLGHPEEAYALYQSILREFPSYPDKRTFYERLARLAEKMGKTGEAEEYERLARQAG